MVLWHLGIATGLVYVTLGRARIDYRFILIGALAPDVVDALLGLFVYDEVSWRGGAHSLLACVVVAVGVLVATRGARRLSWFGVPVGWLAHLVADGMWAVPVTFYWPAFGTAFADAPAEPYSWDVIVDPLAHGWTWAGEVAGGLLLAWFWIAFLRTPERRRRFLRDGRFRA